MHKPIQVLIESRASTNHHDPNRHLSDKEIVDLIGLATRAPAANNFQNWKFIAVRSPKAKARLKTVCYGQQKVVDASVTFIIFGTPAAHEGLRPAWRGT